MVDTPWTFAVIFIAIFGVLLVFALMWLASQHPISTAAHRLSEVSMHGAHTRNLPSDEIDPDA